MKSRRLVFSVIALIVGIALPSASSYAALTPVPAPSAPANVMAWASNQTVRVTWEPPVIAMTYALSNYQINVYQDSHLLEMVRFAAPATEKLITGLPNYHTYTLTVQATQSTVGPNAAESSWSVASAASNPVIPPGGILPSPPSNLNAYASNSAALVTWTAPSSASALTTYQVTAYKAASTGFYAVQRLRTASASPTAAWFTNLENGQSYWFTVEAANFTGWGPESAQTLAAISPTAAVIAVPTLSSLATGDGSATLSWTGPPIGGIDHYVVLVTRPDGTLVTCRDRVVPPLTITGLTNGASYIVQVRAVTTQQVLTPPASAQFVPQAMAQPSVPANVRVALGDRAATLTWDNPISNPQAPIDHYTVSVFLGGTQVWSNQNVRGTSVQVLGLAAGQTYLARVQGVSTAGVTSNSVPLSFVAATLPGTPTNVQAMLLGGQITVSWTAPAYNGFSPVTVYLVRGSTGFANEAVSATVGSPRTSATFANLILGRNYTFTVQALSVVGAGVPSAPSNTVSTATVPGAVQNFSVTAGDESAIVKWDAPASTGGSPILGYQVTAADGVHSPIVTFVSIPSVTLTGLTNGTTYTISVMARNAAGTGNAVSGLARPVNLPPILTIPGNQSIQYGRSLPLTITATGPEATDHLILTASGLPAGLTFTDNGNGTAVITGSVQAAPGPYSVTISANDGHNPVVSQVFGITVSREDAVITSHNPTGLTVKKATDTRTVKVTARLAQSTASAGNLADAGPVTIHLKALGVGTTMTRTATLRKSGNTAIATATFPNLTTNVYRITTSVGGSYYQGKAVSLMTVSSLATRGSIKGSGDVDSTRTPGSIDLDAAIRANGTVSGRLSYSGHHPEGDFTLAVHIVGGLVIKGHRASFQGRGTFNGVAGYRFAVAVLDTRNHDRDGKIAIWTIDPKSQVVEHCSFSLTPITGGQIVVTAH